MNKKKLVLLVGVSAILLAGSSVYAGTTLRLVVNGQVLYPTVEPRVENGTAMVPVRSVAEALGASVGWNDQEQEIRIDLPQATSSQRRIDLLQEALAATTPDEAIRLWTKGLQTRNGALQLAAYSPELQKLKWKSFDQVNWVTGASSPWIDKVDISPGTANTDGTYTYQVKLDWRSSTDLDRPLDWSQIPSFSVVVGKVDDRWYVTDMPGQPKLASATLPDGTSISSRGDWSEASGVKLQLQTIGFAADAADPVQSIVGNHAEVVQKQAVQLPQTAAILALVKRTAPAAAGESEPTYEYWLIVTEDQPDTPGMKYAYSLVGLVEGDLEQAKRTLLEAGNTLTLTPWKQSPEA